MANNDERARNQWLLGLSNKAFILLLIILLPVLLLGLLESRRQQEVSFLQILQISQPKNQKILETSLETLEDALKGKPVQDPLALPNHPIVVPGAALGESRALKKGSSESHPFRCSTRQDLQEFGATGNCIAGISYREAEISGVLLESDQELGNRIGPILRSLFAEVSSASSKELPSPEVLFAHVALEGSAGKRWFFFYPAAAIGPTFEYQSRPWHRSSYLLGDLLVSPIYMDYTQAIPVITLGMTKSIEASEFSISQSPDSSNLKLTLSVDVAVRPASGLTRSLILNLFIVAAASLFLWQYFLLLRQTWIKFLATAFLCVTAGYGLLLAVGLTVPSQDLPAAVADVYRHWLFLLPSETLLLISAWLMNNRPAPRWIWALVYAVQLFLGCLNWIFETEFFSSLAAFLALLFFSLGAARFGRETGAASDVQQLPAPHTWGLLTGVSFFFWGTAQFCFSLASVSWPGLWQRFLLWQLPTGLLDLLALEATAFEILFAAKLVGIVILLVFLGSIQGAESRSLVSSDHIPALRVEEDGTIITIKDLPSECADHKGERLQALVEDPVDCTEVSEILSQHLLAIKFTCRLGGAFKHELYRLDFLPNNREPTTLVTIRRFELEAMLQEINIHICRDAISFVGDVVEHGISASPGSTLPDTLSATGNTLTRQAAESLTLALSKRSAAYFRVSGEKAEAILSTTLAAIRTIFPVCRLQGFPQAGPLPGSLRIPEGLLRVCLERVVSSLQDSSRALEAHLEQLRVGWLLGRDDPLFFLSSNYVCAVFQLWLGIDSALLNAASSDQRDPRVTAVTEMGRKLDEVERLLQFFDGMIDYDFLEGGTFAISLKFRFYETS